MKKIENFLKIFAFMKLHGNKFHFIRHAETAWNDRQLCQGIRDIDLNEKGWKNSLDFAKKLSKFPIECICSSPLKRALNTAKMIHQYHPKAQFKIIEELKERNWGELEGISSNQMYEVEKKEELDSDYIPGQGIEPRANLRSRVVNGLNNAFEFCSQPLILSHGRIFLVLCELLNLPLERQISNLTLMEFSFDGSVWSYINIKLDK